MPRRSGIVSASDLDPLGKLLCCLLAALVPVRPHCCCCAAFSQCCVTRGPRSLLLCCLLTLLHDVPLHCCCCSLIAKVDSTPAGLFGAGRQKAATASQDPAKEAQSCEPQHAAAAAESASVAGSEAAAGPLVQLQGSVQRLQVEAGLAPLRPMQSAPAHVGDYSRPQWPADQEAAQKALQRLAALRREAASLLPKASDQMHCCDCCCSAKTVLACCLNYSCFLKDTFHCSERMDGLLCVMASILE